MNLNKNRSFKGKDKYFKKKLLWRKKMYDIVPVRGRTQCQKTSTQAFK